MVGVMALVIAVLLVIGAGAMPKPRSYLPAIVTLIAIMLVLAIAFGEWLYPEIISKKYVAWILIVSVVIPVLFYVCTARREKLTAALGKLDADDLTL